MRPVHIIISLMTFSSTLAKSQSLLKKNESVIFYFQTEKSKEVLLAKDTSNKYIVYRFGNSQHTELEYPKMDKSSWKLFTYSFYLRGGGVANEGLDLNKVTFKNGNFKYEIFQEYEAADNSTDIGVRVLDSSNNKIATIKGKKDTVKGSLINLRDNFLINKSEYEEE